MGQATCDSKNWTKILNHLKEKIVSILCLPRQNVSLTVYFLSEFENLTRINILSADIAILILLKSLDSAARTTWSKTFDIQSTRLEHSYLYVVGVVFNAVILQVEVQALKPTHGLPLLVSAEPFPLRKLLIIVPKAKTWLCQRQWACQGTYGSQISLTLHWWMCLKLCAFLAYLK